MHCQKCNSTRIAEIGGKVSDMCFISLPNNKEHDGYVPDDMGIGCGDYLGFSLCLDCGQVQGNWPLPLSKLELK